jgi:hypothetical protein
MGNAHIFGEFAKDQWMHNAFLQGALFSFGEFLDAGFLYRNLSPGFQSLYSSAFTENTVPANERGLYSALSFKTRTGIKCDLYYDVFEFPWLKYLVDGPSRGRDFLVQMIATPNKFWSLKAMYKQEEKPSDAIIQNGRTHEIINPVKKKIRLETDYTVTRRLQGFSRMEWLVIRKNGGLPEHGFMGMTGMTYNSSGFSINSGLCIFETDNYDTRIYAYEPDLQYVFSLPESYGNGIHYYINLRKDLLRPSRQSSCHFKLTAWIRWGQTFYPGANSIGSGLDEIAGNRRSEIKAQLLFQWQ